MKPSVRLFLGCIFFGGQFVSAQLPHPLIGMSKPGKSFYSRASTAATWVGQARIQDVMLGETHEKKNVGIAVVYSLLLPGMGELYAGNYESGKYFTIAEGALWITFGSLQWYANWLRDDSRRFAIQHGQVNIDGKSDEFFVQIGDYKDVYEFNEQMLRGRDPQKIHPPNSSYYWKWDVDANRERYRDLRVATDERFNDLTFVVAAIGVNHIVSAINAARVVITRNNEAERSESINLHADVLGGLAHPHGIVLSFSKNF